MKLRQRLQAKAKQVGYKIRRMSKLELRERGLPAASLIFVKDGVSSKPWVGWWKDFRQSWKKHLCDAAGLNLPRFTPTARESFFTQELQNHSKLKPGKVPNKEFQRLWQTITKRWARTPGAQQEENDD